MSKYPIKSIFEQIAEKVFVIKNIDEAKQFIIDFVNSKDIKETDKQLIITNVNNCKTIIKIQNYICNSLLKYEGMSVGSRKNEKDIQVDLFD